jgi:hypothetical protein
MAESIVSGVAESPERSNRRWAYVEVEEGEFADRACEVCGARPSVLRVARAAGACGPRRAPDEYEAHDFCAAHETAAGDVYRRLAEA